MIASSISSFGPTPTASRTGGKSARSHPVRCLVKLSFYCFIAGLIIGIVIGVATFATT